MLQTLICNQYILATQRRRPLIIKYQRFKPLGWKEIGIRIFGNT